MSCVVLIMHVPTYPQGTYGVFVHTCVWMDVGAAVTQYNWACMGCQTIQDFTAVPHSTHSVGPGVWVAGAMSDLI